MTQTVAALIIAIGEANATNTAVAAVTQTHVASLWTPSCTPTSTATLNSTPIPDIYEPDNTAAQASWLYTGNQLHSITPKTDADWVRFTVAQDSVVTLETTGPAGNDTAINLYSSSDPVNAISSNDDKSVYDYYSQITITLAAGTYYLQVLSHNQQVEIFSYYINLSMTACTPTPTATATCTVTNTGTRTRTFTITATHTATATKTITPTNTPVHPFLVQYSSFSYNPKAIVADNNGYFYVTDNGSTINRIVKISVATGLKVIEFSSQGSNPGQIYQPMGLAMNTNGNILVSDTGNGRIEEFTTGGSFVRQFGTKGYSPGQLQSPYGLTCGKNGNIYVADYYRNVMLEYSQAGVFINEFHGIPNFSYAFDVAADSSGNLYVSDYGNHIIQKFTSDGAYIMQWPVSGSYGIAIDGNNLIYSASPYYLEIYTASGDFLARMSGYDSGYGSFHMLSSIDVEADGHIYVTDSWTTSGNFSRFGP
jgi:hypothetical protein